MNQDPVQRVLARLQNVKSGGSSFTARCPSHEDQNNSLSIDYGTGGRALLRCHAGCRCNEIVQAMGLQMCDLFSSEQETDLEQKTDLEQETGLEQGGGTLRFSTSTPQHFVDNTQKRFVDNTQNNGADDSSRGRSEPVIESDTVHRADHGIADGTPGGTAGEISTNMTDNADDVDNAGHAANAGQIGCTLAQYAELKKLPIEFLQMCGLTDVSRMSQPAVRIPYRDPSGDDVAIRFRTALQKSDGGDDNRFRWGKGSKTCLYGLHRLATIQEAGYVVLVEGESDAQTLWFHGIAALGLPGASTWKEEWATHLEGVPVVYAIIEKDKGGATVLESLTKSKLRERIRIIDLGDFKDPSELHQHNPGGFVSAWQSARDAATPLSDLLQSEKLELSRQAWERCQSLAQRPDIVERFAQAIASSGLAGEKRHAMILFLAVISRLLPFDHRCVSVVVKGPSSAGKSHLVDKVLAFFPAKAFYALSAISEHALAYSEEPLSHRMLVIYEAAGMNGEFSTYLIRSLLSEGRVRYETVEKTKDKMKARLIEREGPTGLIVTTTHAALHPENETRLLSLTLTDSPEQTRNVLLALAEDNTERVNFDYSQWHALQQWLETRDNRVHIPFAPTLANSIPPIAVRLRRDFNAVLSLIRAHAVLHQAGRERDGKGRIIAAIEDYEVVWELIAALVAEGIETTVPNSVREVVEAVIELDCQNDTSSNDTSSKDKSAAVSVTQIAKHLKLDKAAVSRRVSRCLKSGYLSKQEERKGKPSRLVVGDPLPEEQEILPSPDRLRALLHHERAGGCCGVDPANQENTNPPAPLPDRPAPLRDNCASPSDDVSSYSNSDTCEQEYSARDSKENISTQFAAPSSDPHGGYDGDENYDEDEDNEGDIFDDEPESTTGSDAEEATAAPPRLLDLEPAELSALNSNSYGIR